MSQRCALCSVNYPSNRAECLRCGNPLRPSTETVTDDWANVDDLPDCSEQTKVELWRLHVLVEAGYPIDQAEKLAAAGDVDLHTATTLVTERGCKPELAAEILL